MIRDYTDYVEDILNSINDIEEFTGDTNFDIFCYDKKSINATIRSLEVLGEAASKIPCEIRDNYPDIPWKKMVGMRNKLIHEYFGVDLEIVWAVCTEELPPIKPLLQKLQHDMSLKFPEGK
ncbi:MAG: DUF86 domain-containing protein [Candidatus Omnitrophota bacterium]